MFTVVFKDASGREQFRSPLFNVEVSEKRINNAFTTQSLATIDQYLPASNYSISIRKAFSPEKPRQHAVANRNYVAKGLQELQNTSVFSAIEEQPLPEKVGLLPEYRYQLLEGTLAHHIYGTRVVHERHRHRYEFNNDFREKLTAKDLVVSGTSPDGRLVEIIELKNHPWFLGTQFHPEYHSRPHRPHPIFSAFVEAALKRKFGR